MQQENKRDKAMRDTESKYHCHIIILAELSTHFTC